MASTETITEYYANQDQGPHILAAAWLMTAFATLVVAGRFYIRYSVIRKGGADDWWMLGGLTFLCTLAGLISGMARLGGFKHESTLDPATLERVKQLFWASQPVGLVGSLLPKISIGLQLLYIMPRSGSFRWKRQLVWFCMGLSVITNLLVFPMVFAQCSPASALWSTEGGECWKPEVNTVYFTVAALVNAAVDFVFASIPINIIMNLRISFINKALLINFLGARMFAFIAGVTKASYIAKNGFAVGDLTWNAFDFLLWQTAEQFCLCFCGSFPTYKALFDRWLKRRASLKAGSSGVGYSSRPGTPPPVWFYEAKCFETPKIGDIHVDTLMEVTYQERIDSTDRLPGTTSPSIPRKSDVNIVATSMV